VLKKNGLLTRDARAKERKKYGLKRAAKPAVHETLGNCGLKIADCGFQAGL